MEAIAVDAVNQLLESAEWQLNLQSFIDSHCYQFIETESGGGHLHGHFEVFQEFVQLKETIISSAISELGVSVEAFCAAAEVRIKGKDSQACKLLDLILYLDDFEAFAKLMRKRLGELANNGPFGAAPVASMSSSAGGRASRSDGGASAGEMSSTPMYMWDPSWHQYVQLAQGIVRASFTGHLADGEKALLPWAQAVSELEIHREARTHRSDPMVISVEAVLRQQWSLVESSVRDRIGGGTIVRGSSGSGSGYMGAGTPSTASATPLSSGPSSVPAAAPAPSASQSPSPAVAVIAPTPAPALRDSPRSGFSESKAGESEVTRTLALQLELERHEREQREQEIENLRKRVEKMEQEKVDKDETISAESPEEAAARRRRREWIMGLGDKPASSKAMPTVPESAPVTTVPSPTTHYAEPQPGQLFSNLQVSPAATTYQSYAFGYDPTQSQMSFGGGTEYYQAGYGAAAAGGYPAGGYPATGYVSGGYGYDPALWTRSYDATTGYYFWTNNVTGESQWEETSG